MPAIKTNSLESIFNAALDLADAQERTAYLDHSCRENPDLRRRIELLLSAYGEGQFLESPAGGLAATAVLPPVSEKPGATIGPYKLLEQIGEGGMGLVFMAEQSQPLRRRVALKIIKPGMDTGQVIARFEAERQALALMDHPNIARVYDAGATESGRPYFVMELVRGAPITDYCRDRNLSLRERLELFIDVCQAVQHAHQKGLIHRDLKPTNILVSQTDTAPVPKVIDFGVAKATTQPLTDRTLFTHFSQIIGTPLYMSPEQADLGNQDVDTRSDVYSLGVVLYELLTGTTPFDAERLRSVSHDEMRRIIREEEPPKPSTRATTEAVAMTTVATKPPIAPQLTASALKGDLDWIVMKALDKDRRRRYESPSAMAADLRRFLERQPVHARPPTYRDKLAKWSSRHVGLIWSTLAAALFIATAFGLSAAMIAESRDEADENRQIAVAERNAANEERNLAIAARNEATDSFQLARSAVDKLMTRVSEEQLLNVPKMEKLRNSLLSDALEFYEQLLKRDSENTELQHELALAQRRVGEILSLMDRRQESLAAHNDAIRRLRELVASNPEVPAFKFSLAEALRFSSQNLLKVAFSGSAATEREAGQENAREAVLLLQELNQADPNNPEYQFALAEAYLESWHNATANLSPIIHNAEPVAVEQLRQALEVIEPLARAPLATLKQKQLYVAVLGNLASNLSATEEARHAFEEAVRIDRELIQADPTDKLYRANLADIQGNYANSFPPEDPDKVIAQRQECIAIFEGLVGDFPSVPDYRAKLAIAHTMAAHAYTTDLKTPNLPASLEHSVCAKTILEELIRENPGFKDNYNLLERVLTNVFATQRDIGTIDESAADELRKFFLRRAEDLNEDDPIAKASQIEWMYYVYLTGQEQHAEAANWADDACQHMRMFFAKRTKNPKEKLKLKDYDWLLIFPSELRSRGFEDEAAEFNEEAVGLFDDRELGEFGEYYAARGNFAEAAMAFHEALRGIPAIIRRQCVWP